MEHRGIEPRFSACKTDVFPLDERPLLFRCQCPEQESNLQTLAFKANRSAGWRI